MRRTTKHRCHRGLAAPNSDADPSRPQETGRFALHGAIQLSGSFSSLYFSSGPRSTLWTSVGRCTLAGFNFTTDEVM